MREEIGQIFHRLLEYLHARQVDDTEVVGLAPVKAATAGDQDLLLMQQVERELLVIRDIELLDVHLGEDIERSLGLHRRDTVDGIERLVHVVALLVHP